MNNATILIVDDDPNIRELISVNLLSAGYTVIEASNGREAMGKMQESPPDLIVLDIMMPEIDGWEFCKFVRDDPLLEKIKIIMLTAKGTEKDKLIGREIFRADEYMTKPFDIDELKKNVERLLHA
jgi:Response regulators consisting of a CheY-like receiver domain and a winged-helix DNA-binding domain